MSAPETWIAFQNDSQKDHGQWSVGIEHKMSGCHGCGEGDRFMLVGGCCTQDDALKMAAANELLEACRAMIRWDDAEKNAKPFDDDQGAGFYARIDMCDEAFLKARAAIAKATGALK